MYLMTNSQIITEKLTKAAKVHVFNINQDGSRGDELKVNEWNGCDPVAFDLDTSSLRLIDGEGFDLWFDECEEAVINGDTFKVKNIEVVVS
jgi:hypothetical protein